MNAVEVGIYNKLVASAGLNALLATPPAGTTKSIYNTRIAEKATYPCVVFQLYDGGDDNEAPSRARSLVYIVKGLSTLSMDDAGLIDAQIDAALHMQTLTVSGWTNYLTRREGDIELVENDSGTGGKTFYHQGGLYRIRISQ